jgi:TATA-box binding protein (TBP) (component of TFIID and TFIIIB)
VKNVTLLPEIRNIVATTDTGVRIDLSSAIYSLPRSIHEPEQFRGIIHKTLAGISIFISAPGKMVIAGAKSEAQINDLLQRVIPKLEVFRVS